MLGVHQPISLTKSVSSYDSVHPGKKRGETQVYILPHGNPEEGSGFLLCMTVKHAEFYSPTPHVQLVCVSPWE